MLELCLIAGLSRILSPLVVQYVLPEDGHSPDKFRLLPLLLYLVINEGLEDTLKS